MKQLRLIKVYEKDGREYIEPNYDVLDGLTYRLPD